MQDDRQDLIMTLVDDYASYLEGLDYDEIEAIMEEGVLTIREARDLRFKRKNVKTRR